MVIAYGITVYGLTEPRAREWLQEAIMRELRNCEGIDVSEDFSLTVVCSRVYVPKGQALRAILSTSTPYSDYDGSMVRQAQEETRKVLDQELKWQGLIIVEASNT